MTEEGLTLEGEPRLELVEGAGSSDSGSMVEIFIETDELIWGKVIKVR